MAPERKRGIPRMVSIFFFKKCLNLPDICPNRTFLLRRERLMIEWSQYFGLCAAGRTAPQEVHPLLITKTLEDYQNHGSRFWIQRSSHEKHTAPEEHRHDFYELVYVVHGQGIHRIGGTAYTIHPGDVFVIRPGDVHQYMLSGDYGVEIINCLFSAAYVAEALELDREGLEQLPYLRPFYREDEGFVPAFPLNTQESSAILNLLEAMLREMKTRAPGFEVLIRHKLIEVLILLSRFRLQEQSESAKIHVTGGYEILVRRIRVYLERNFHEKITLAMLSRQFNLSERHINRVFKQETGASIMEMLQQIRIERAKHLLGETNRSIDSVAHAVGFGDSSFFSRLFSRKVGCTPGGYRKRARKKNG